jgi:hypothetical protein
MIIGKNAWAIVLASGDRAELAQVGHAAARSEHHDARKRRRHRLRRAVVAGLAQRVIAG